MPLSKYVQRVWLNCRAVLIKRTFVWSTSVALLHGHYRSQQSEKFCWYCLLSASTHSARKHHLLPPSSPICLCRLLSSRSIQRVIVNPWRISSCSGDSGNHCQLPWPQWTSATIDQLTLCSENNISCNHGRVPEPRERNRQCDWHRVTNSLNSDNRKLMQWAPLKAQHIASSTLKLTRLSRWHMLIP